MAIFEPPGGVQGPDQEQKMPLNGLIVIRPKLAENKQKTGLEFFAQAFEKVLAFRKLWQYNIKARLCDFGR